MMRTLKAEAYKLLSVRSTYIITGLAMALIAFLAFYIGGWRADSVALHNPDYLAGSAVGAGSALGTLSIMMPFSAILGILFMSHEYRYGTIMYTLTASNSRSKVLLAKLLTISVFGILFALVVSAFTPVMDYLGIHAHGHALVPQVLNYGNLLWRGLYFGWGIATTGLLLATLIRSQVGAIVVLFLVQTIESGLLEPVLKNDSVYLPFMSLDEVLIHPERGTITHAHAALVFGMYLVVGWVVAWALFLKRDAN